VAKDRHLADWKFKGTTKMRDRDLIKDRWIKRTHGERSEHHKAPSQILAYCDLE
jgi:hypothetical protein